MTPEWVKSAKIGDEVVCIRNRWCPNGGKQLRQGIPCPLELKKIYIIAKIGDGYGVSFDGQYGRRDFFWFKEVTHPNGYTGFDVRRFRPVKKSSTDKAMKQLRTLLHGAPVRETV